MNIAIVTPIFDESIGYQEVYLAKTYSSLGYFVKVFTSTAMSKSGKKFIEHKYKEGESIGEKGKYLVQRFSPIIKIGSKVIVHGLNKNVFEFNPDYLIIIGLANIFAISLFFIKKRNFKIIVILNDTRQSLEISDTKSKFLLFIYTIQNYLVKKIIYRKALHKFDRFVYNIPEGLTFSKSILKKESDLLLLDKKKMMLSLGYLPEDFYFYYDYRNNIRKKNGIDDQTVVFVTITRMAKGKNIIELIDIVINLYRKGYKIKYILIGFLNDQYGEEIKKYINYMEASKIIICYPFLEKNEINKIYSAADIGIWPSVSHSIIEALGTGLKVLLENKETVNHLIFHGYNGWYFEKGRLSITIEEILDQNKIKNNYLINNNIKRKELEKSNRDRFSYYTIANTIISNLS